MSVVPMPGTAPSARHLLLNGIFAENPVFRLALSLCPAVAVTTSGRIAACADGVSSWSPN